MTDESYMRIVLRLAARAKGRTSPNPMVGAVLVKRDRIIGKGYHQGPGMPHAEIVALQEAGRKALGATLYTNLEPCCHLSKRTPPCTRELIHQKIEKVVVAMRDPNPQVCGRGLQELKRAGVVVEEGILHKEAFHLNEAYTKYITQRRPFVILKIAQSLDGKIATSGGESRWITSAQARAHVHRFRSEADAVMVGIGTVSRDDARLTIRKGVRERKQPFRIVVDSSLRISPNARVLRQLPPEKTILATTSQAPQGRIRELEGLGVRVLVVKERDGRVDLSDLMRLLGEMEVMTVMIEGGSELNASAIRQGIVDKVLFFLAPGIIGGQDAKGSIGGISPRHLSDMVHVSNLKVRRIGYDLLLDGYLTPPRV